MHIAHWYTLTGTISGARIQMLSQHMFRAVFGVFCQTPVSTLRLNCIWISCATQIATKSCRRVLSLSFSAFFAPIAWIVLYALVIVVYCFAYKCENRLVHKQFRLLLHVFPLRSFQLMPFSLASLCVRSFARTFLLSLSSSTVSFVTTSNRSMFFSLRFCAVLFLLSLGCVLLCRCRCYSPATPFVSFCWNATIFNIIRLHFSPPLYSRSQSFFLSLSHFSRPSLSSTYTFENKQLWDCEGKRARGREREREGEANRMQILSLVCCRVILFLAIFHANCFVVISCAVHKQLNNISSRIAVEQQ